jgi:hypothetical protein
MVSPDVDSDDEYPPVNMHPPLAVLEPLTHEQLAAYMAANLLSEAADYGDTREYAEMFFGEDLWDPRWNIPSPGPAPDSISTSPKPALPSSASSVGTPAPLLDTTAAGRLAGLDRQQTVPVQNDPPNSALP